MLAFQAWDQKTAAFGLSAEQEDAGATFRKGLCVQASRNPREPLYVLGSGDHRDRYEIYFYIDHHIF